MQRVIDYFTTHRARTNSSSCNVRNAIIKTGV